jgi:hypothetical protein
MDNLDPEPRASAVDRPITILIDILLRVDLFFFHESLPWSCALFLQLLKSLCVQLRNRHRAQNSESTPSAAGFLSDIRCRHLIQTQVITSTRVSHCFYSFYRISLTHARRGQIRVRDASHVEVVGLRAGPPAHA